ncbi:MAG: hypothetical protein A2Y10_20055 [Planctomycetes bacterium GWF2_41_51]|nr:MAG: hypothetical protein A2Y10_20055 [Planctomycetes bacterium GWF2_41_51]
MSTGKNIIRLSLICLFSLLMNASALHAAHESFFLNSSAFNPNQPDYAVQFGFYPSGYSDGWLWYGEEMLSGEWAAAITYNGIHNNHSNWLESHFSYPYWNPDTRFVPDSWPDSTPRLTAQSIIHDPNIQVMIDYKLIDLGEDGYVAMPFYPQSYSGSDVPYARSERYILIQSYNIKNTTSNNITGVKFYQMLTGWYAGMYNCTYSNALIPGLLDGSYDPCNPNSPIAFKYVSTQWTNGTDPNYIEWECFCSTLEPTWIDSGIYDTGSGGDETPGYTTYRIRNCNLNDDPNIYDTYAVAGSMGWDLGTLAPGQTKSITLAAMFGTGPVQYATPIPPLPEGIEININKYDDVNDGDCVVTSTPTIESDINYTIDYSIMGNPWNPNPIEVNEICIVDFLPKSGVDFVSAEPNTYDYNDITKTVTWEIGDVNIRGLGVVGFHSVKVKVREDCPQGTTLTNTVKIYSGGNLIKTATEYTNICCTYDTVFVDDDAEPNGNGRTWDTAYDNLQDAFTNVLAGNHGCADKIFVAAGTYYPTDDPQDTSATFQLINSINIYGHFAGCETSPDQRNLADSNFTSVLSGDPDIDNDRDIYNVVTAANCTIDGFTIKKGASYGILCDADSPTIQNCVITDNVKGIYCDNGSHTNIFNTFVNYNSSDGVMSWNANTKVNIDQCTIRNCSPGVGVNSNTEANITNTIIDHCGKAIDSFGNINVDKCTISENTGWWKPAIQLNYGSGNIKDSIISGTQGDSGIAAYAELIVERCEISQNNGYGVYIGWEVTNVNVLNNWIFKNQDSGVYTDSFAEIRNNTIVSNNSYGFSGSGDPNINSNIIYWNNSSCEQFDDSWNSFTKVNYNCVQDGYNGTGNIPDNPQFVDSVNDDYHLIAESNCIDAGNQLFTTSTETDIDGEDRIINGCVDIGADEFQPYDLTGENQTQDGFINFLDYAVYVEDGNIDFEDFAVFCSYWLTPSDWQGIGGSGAYFEDTPYECQQQMMMGFMELESEQMMIAEPEPVDIEMLVNWLDDLWQNDEEIRNSMTEEEFLNFRNAIEELE